MASMFLRVGQFLRVMGSSCNFRVTHLAVKHRAEGYYEQIVKNMPGPVLRSHGIVERDGERYALQRDLVDLSDAERADLVAACRASALAILR